MFSMFLTDCKDVINAILRENPADKVLANLVKNPAHYANAYQPHLSDTLTRVMADVERASNFVSDSRPDPNNIEFDEVNGQIDDLIEQIDTLPTTFRTVLDEIFTELLWKKAKKRFKANVAKGYLTNSENWVSVDDFLPKPFANVLVCSENGNVCPAFLNDDCFYDDEERPINGVSHWFNG